MSKINRMKDRDLLKQKIRKYYKDKYGWEMTDSEYEETRESLMHLGKAIYLYHEEKNST